MFTPQDIRQIEERGMSVSQVEQQLNAIQQGFPYLKIEAPASTEKGIMVVDKEALTHYINIWEAYSKEGHRIVKFVPASGAASRMFKSLFAFLDADYDVPTTDFEQTFFEQRRKFAFRKALCAACKEQNDASVCDLVDAGKYKSIVKALLGADGLNYGQLPKGLLLFHDYAEGARTPVEEHLVEAALYASSNGETNVHFTVSHEHLKLFDDTVKAKLGHYEAKFGIRINVSFSEQKPSTDTIAANPDGSPFRNDDDTLLFRPGGHGALIENLNDIDADVVFIKNIDNVVPDRLKGDTVTYKKLLAGILIDLQRRSFEYLDLLDTGRYTHDQLEEMIRFVQRDLSCRNKEIKEMEDSELALYLRKKLNRPLRVCGMVKNVGEPGGGPFLCYNQDGTISPQILESSQIDTNSEECVRMFREGTHFNPVDLVCATKDYQNRPFNLPDYVDKSTGFISNKSKSGRELKALELPGLWNGAMSDWNTVFVEVPISTFNPVKTVNDLLREQHQ